MAISVYGKTKSYSVIPHAELERLIKNKATKYNYYANEEERLSNEDIEGYCAVISAAVVISRQLGMELVMQA